MKATIGRIVHYVEEYAQGQIHHRPAIVIGVPAEDQQPYTPVVILRVLVPGQKDFEMTAHQDEESKLPTTWHWPEREEAQGTPSNINEIIEGMKETQLSIRSAIPLNMPQKAIQAVKNGLDDMDVYITRIESTISRPTQT